MLNSFRRIAVYFVALLLLGCASTGTQPVQQLTESHVTKFILESSEIMESHDIRKFASRLSSDFVYEDDISTKSPIRWDFHSYVTKAAQLYKNSTKVKSDTSVESITIDDPLNSATAVIKQTTRITASERTHQSQSIQEVKLVLKDGKILCSRIKLLKDLGHGVI